MNLALVGPAQWRKQDRGFARFELVVLHENWLQKMGLIFPRAAFSKSAIKTLASKWEQGSRSLGCSGTMFRRDGPRFPHGTGLVPEQNFIIPVFISLFILVPLAADCKIPDASLVIWLILHLVPWYRNIWHHFLTENRSCSGTFFRFSPKTMKFRDNLIVKEPVFRSDLLPCFRHWYQYPTCFLCSMISFW